MHSRFAVLLAAGAMWLSFSTIDAHAVLVCKPGEILVTSPNGEFCYGYLPIDEVKLVPIVMDDPPLILPSKWLCGGMMIKHASKLVKGLGTCAVDVTRDGGDAAAAAACVAAVRSKFDERLAKIETKGECDLSCSLDYFGTIKLAYQFVGESLQAIGTCPNNCNCIAPHCSLNAAESCATDADCQVLNAGVCTGCSHFDCPVSAYDY